MKIVGFLVIVSAVLVACNNNGKVRISTDSLDEKFDSAAERTWDSTKKGLKSLKEDIKNKLEHKDSLRFFKQSK